MFVDFSNLSFNTKAQWAQRRGEIRTFVRLTVHVFAARATLGCEKSESSGPIPYIPTWTSRSFSPKVPHEPQINP